MARVSVLMSCYGTGRWLWEALDSLPWDMLALLARVIGGERW